MTRNRDHINSPSRKESELEEKLAYEYEIFFRDCMRQSKSGVYAKSEEIYLKKQILKSLKQDLSYSEKMEKELLAVDNIMEDVYRYVMDHQEDGEIDVLVKKWIRNFQSESEV